MKQYLILLFFLLVGVSIIAQPLTQVIKGKITDETSGRPIPFATIVVKNTDPLLGTITDNEGSFTLKNVPVGRHDLETSCIGYEPVLIREQLVTSGKQTEIFISLKESVVELGEIKVKPKTNKEQPLNSMALVSSRMLSVEEAKRYAGGFDDPARLASSFAGVASNIGNNGIIIRGNAPHLLSWRLEGVEIPNPNHFADMSAFGAGGLTALSSQLLSNSDFYTGAFPAEYGNAMSGVFDIFMRPGNNSQMEHTFQIGLIGIDAASEGPFSKKGKSSYLFNYRYSTLALMTPLLPEDADGTRYQDLAFKLNFPTLNAGTFSIWGIGLTDISGSEAERDTTLWMYHQDRQTQTVGQFMAAGGITHKLFMGNSSVLQTCLAASGSGLDMKTDEFYKPVNFYHKDRINNLNLNFILSGSLNHKFSARHTNKTGYIATLLKYNMLMKNAPDSDEPLLTIVDRTGTTMLLSGYSNSQFRFSDELTFSAGVHGQYFLLNKNYTIEPRLSGKWQFTGKQSVGFAYGMHSRLERLNIYFATDDKGAQVNKDLGFARAQHFVLNYDLSLGDNTRFKAEPYFQWLTNLPVEPGESFALINLRDDWFLNRKLTNSGKGYNTGIDLTIEQFIHKGFYYLLTTSVFNSRYQGGDRIWRNTRYNRNYLFNFLAGKEWATGRQKQNLFSLNGRISCQGGDRIIPVDNKASEQSGDVIPDENRAFEEQLDPALLLHFTLNYRINKQKYSSTWSFQMINATGVKEFYGFRQNLKTGFIEPNKEAIVIPNLSYKIEF